MPQTCAQNRKRVLNSLSHLRNNAWQARSTSGKQQLVKPTGIKGHTSRPEINHYLSGAMEELQELATPARGGTSSSWPSKLQAVASLEHKVVRSSGTRAVRCCVPHWWTCLFSFLGGGDERLLHLYWIWSKYGGPAAGSFGVSSFFLLISEEMQSWESSGGNRSSSQHLWAWWHTRVLVTPSYLSKLAQHVLLQIVSSDRRNLRTCLQPCGFCVLLCNHALTRLSPKGCWDSQACSKWAVPINVPWMLVQ